MFQTVQMNYRYPLNLIMNTHAHTEIHTYIYTYTLVIYIYLYINQSYTVYPFGVYLEGKWAGCMLAADPVIAHLLYPIIVPRGEHVVEAGQSEFTQGLFKQN